MITKREFRTYKGHVYKLVKINIMLYQIRMNNQILYSGVHYNAVANFEHIKYLLEKDSQVVKE